MSNDEIEAGLESNISSNEHINVSSYLQYVINNLFILLSTILNLIANRLAFNMILCFKFRNYVQRVSQRVIIFQLLVLEIGMSFNFLIYKLICKITGTKVQKKPSCNDYNKNGIVKFKSIRNSFWTGGMIQYSQDKPLSRNDGKLIPISELLEFQSSMSPQMETQEEIDLGNHDTSNVGYTLKRNTDEEAKSLNLKNPDPILEDINVSSKYLFPFQRRLTKYNETSSNGNNDEDSGSPKDNEEISPRKKFAMIFKHE